MRKIIAIFFLVFSLNTLLAQSQITVSNSSISGINSVFNKTVDNYLGGINKDAGTDLFISGTYPNSGYAIYRKNNSWKISQFSSSFIIGNDILDFSNTELFFYNSTELKPPCSEQWQKNSNSLLEGLTLLGACLGGGDQVTIESSNLNFICSNGNLSIAFSVGGSLNNQNLYEVQISDENGLFNSPLSIGSSNTSPINVSYPANIVSNSTYKLRVKTMNSQNIEILSNEKSISTNLPVPSFLFTGKTICVGSNVTIETITNFSFQIENYKLYKNNTFVSNNIGPNFQISNVSATDEANYTYKYEVNGCLSPASGSIFNLQIVNTASKPWPNINDYAKAFCYTGGNHFINLNLWWNDRVTSGASIKWIRNGEIVLNENSNSLFLGNLNTNNSGYYKFEITNPSCQNSYVSDSFYVGLTDKPILIKSFPDSLNVCEGNFPSIFTEIVDQNGTSYQWQKGTTYLPNQIYSSLNLPIYSQDEGYYRVILKNASCPDSTVSNYVKIIKKNIPIIPQMSLSGIFSTYSNGVITTVQDSIRVVATPNDEYSYKIYVNGQEKIVPNINNYYIKESGGYFLKSQNSFGCVSENPLSNLQIIFDPSGIHLTNCTVPELNGKYNVTSSLPFSVVPDQGTIIYSKDYFPDPTSTNGYFIFRKTGKWRLLRYSSYSPMPGMPPSVSITEYFSSLSASMNVTCDMDWIKTSTQTSEILEFVGNCPLLQSFNNSTNIIETACGSFTIPNGNVVTNSGNYQYIISNSYRADSVITYQVTINPIPTSTISGSSILAPGQSYPVKIKFNGQKPYTVLFNGSTISNIQDDSIFVNVSPSVTTSFTLTSIQNSQCGFGTISGNAYIVVDANHPCLNLREIPLGNSLSGNYQASEFLKSSATIGNATLYRAGKSIELKTGFIAENGSVFKAEIGNCN